MPAPRAWTPRLHGPEARRAAFPLGGIGTGTVSLGSRGELRDWEILNGPDKGSWLPFTFFAISAQPRGGERITRVLEARRTPPYDGDSGLHVGRAEGLPRLSGSELRGEYPLVTVRFTDDDLPVDVELQAFTPLVPLDVPDSGIPGAVLRYRVTNPGDVPVDVSVAGSLSCPVGIVGRDVFQFPRFAATPTVRLQHDRRGTALCFDAGAPADSFDAGTAVLATTDPSVTAVERWPLALWQDGAQLIWDDFAADGRFEPDAGETVGAPSAIERSVPELPRNRTGTLGVVHELAPGEQRDFEFVLTWHVPNRPRAWNGMVGLPNDRAGEVVRNAYAARFADAAAVAAHLLDRLAPLEAATRAFHDALFDSTLPPEMVDAVGSTLVVLRSTTCLLLEDGGEGRFAAWEGSFDHAGSCEGTCTHVWNYAQTVANLFPSLERSARRTEFLEEVLPDGRMRFRTNSVFGNPPLDFEPAADGQLGTIVRLHREWRFSGDDEFLRELWPAAQRALEFAATWDGNGDGVLDRHQHNTYDIEFQGENSLANSMLFAALLAAADMAEHLGDPEAAGRYRDRAASGAAIMDRLLFNGEYYDQRLDEPDRDRYQYGSGCLADQVFGQTLAHLAGLGHVLPAAHVRSAVAAVFRHNHREGFETAASVQRTYALGDDRGLVLCSWPRGGRPRVPFVYSDEVWSGVEYQVATHLVFEGMVEEALTVVRDVRDRYDGVRRNPWNEVECGNHYARSMASWGVLLALTGTFWDGRSGSLTVAPAVAALDADGAFRCLVTTSEGWGNVRITPEEAELHLLHGRVDLRAAELRHPDGATFALASPTTVEAGDRVELPRTA